MKIDGVRLKAAIKFDEDGTPRVVAGRRKKKKHRHKHKHHHVKVDTPKVPEVPEKPEIPDVPETPDVPEGTIPPNTADILDSVDDAYYINFHESLSLDSGGGLRAAFDPDRHEAARDNHYTVSEEESSPLSMVLVDDSPQWQPHGADAHTKVSAPGLSFNCDHIISLIFGVDRSETRSFISSAGGPLSATLAEESVAWATASVGHTRNTNNI